MVQTGVCVLELDIVDVLMRSVLLVFVQGNICFRRTGSSGEHSEEQVVSSF